MSGRVLRLDPGLLSRFLAAGAQIAWREAEAPSARAPPRKPSKSRSNPGVPKARTRLAHLNDEESRVEERTTASGTTVRVDSGPVGALVLLLELQRRGPPTSLDVIDPDSSATFAAGALEACWDEMARPEEYSLPLDDLVRLARYALA